MSKRDTPYCWGATLEGGIAMEEIKQLHSLNLEWGCITNLMDKISTIEDSIEGGWQELVDMVADAMTEEGEEKDLEEEIGKAAK